MKLKIIFLDIDGVLNPSRFMNIFYKVRKELGDGVKTRDEFGHYFAPYTVDALEKIINQTAAKIVVSSVWRRSGLEVMREMWKRRRLPGEIYDVTPVLNVERGYEIAEWLRENDVDSYVIIDDNDDMLPEQNFIQCNNKLGLTDELADKCIQLLDAE